MTNFVFLQTEWLSLFADAQKTEAAVIPDPRTACFYARRTLEQVVEWLYKSDSSLKLPYQDNLSALIHEPTFKNTVGAKIFVKAKLIKDLGNLAAHSGFLSGQTLNANQIHFVNLIIDFLTQSGWMSAAQLYESPFLDFSPRGIDGVFKPEQVTQVVSILDEIRDFATI